MVRNITIEGNERTKVFVIEREILLKADKSYAIDSILSLIELSENRVMNLNLFNQVSSSFNRDYDSLDLKFIVVEKWFDWPIPFLEFSDRNFNVWSNFQFDPERTNYGLYLFNYNVFGRNHTLKTSFVRGYNSSYGLEYRLPFISQESNWGIQGKAKYSSQSEMWLNTENDKLQFYKNGNPDLIKRVEGEVSFSNRFDPFTTANIGFKSQQINLDQSLDTLATPYLLSSNNELNVTEISASIERDSRDNIYFPLQGFYLKPTIALQHFRGSETFSNFYASYKIQHFAKLENPRWYYALSLYGEINTDTFLPYEYTRRLGYDNLVRGFENYVVDGNNSFLVKSAIRYHLLDRSNLTFNFIPIKNYKVLPTNIFVEYFIDAGLINNKIPVKQNELTNSLLMGTGLSFQLLLYNDRILRLDFSLNSKKEGGFFVHFTKAI
mgnify:CR=1 FL=1